MIASVRIGREIESRAQVPRAEWAAGGHRVSLEGQKRTLEEGSSGDCSSPVECLPLRGHFKGVPSLTALTWHCCPCPMK